MRKLKEVNKYVFYGLLLNILSLSLMNFTNFFAETIKGFFIGLGLALIFIGIYSDNHDISKLKNSKKYILNRILSK